MAGGPVGGQAVGAGQHPGGEIDHAGAVGAHIGALIVEEAVLDAENEAARIHGGANLVALLARMIGRHEMLLAILDPFDRPAEPQRAEADQHVLRIELAPHPEAAAHMAFEQMHRRRAAAAAAGRAARDCDAAPWRRHAAPAHPGRNRSARWRRASRAERPNGGRSKDRARSTAWALRNACSRSPYCFSMIIGSLDSPGANSPGARIGRHQGRQLVEIDRDLIGGVLGLIGILREHHRDRLAHVAHPLARQHRLAIGHELLDPIVAEIDRRQVGEIAAGPDRHHAGRRQRLGDLDGAEPGMGDGRADHAHMQLMRETRHRPRTARGPAPAGHPRAA